MKKQNLINGFFSDMFRFHFLFFVSLVMEFPLNFDCFYFIFLSFKFGCICSQVQIDFTWDYRISLISLNFFCLRL